MKLNRASIEDRMNATAALPAVARIRRPSMVSRTARTSGSRTERGAHPIACSQPDTTGRLGPKSRNQPAVHGHNWSATATRRQRDDRPLKAVDRRDFEILLEFEPFRATAARKASKPTATIFRSNPRRRLLDFNARLQSRMPASGSRPPASPVRLRRQTAGNVICHLRRTTFARP